MPIYSTNSAWITVDKNLPFEHVGAYLPESYEFQNSSAVQISLLPERPVFSGRGTGSRWSEALEKPKQFAIPVNIGNDWVVLVVGANTEAEKQPSQPSTVGEKLIANSRQIEFSYIMNGHGSKHWRAIPYRRHLVDRRILLNHQPQGFLEGERELAMILSRLARRYTRTAFPEVFVEQIKERYSAISKKFVRLNSLITNIYIRLEPFEEIRVDESYNIELILVMDSEKYEDAAHFDKCTEIKNQLEKQLDNCDRIKVTDINIESTEGIMFDDLKGFKVWDYSYLSFRDPDESKIPHDPPHIVL